MKPLEDTQGLSGVSPTKISNIAQSSPGVAPTCGNSALTTGRQDKAARHNRPLQALI